ncbi:unnamed protein product [Linum tenue]|uniref:Uncharacterized protein n=1 Tax=Linum tenue TaxID=586396 RepID=A0AAV0KI90_9ROSI|nr:unnamed protein product [Linum tenue]
MVLGANCQSYISNPLCLNISHCVSKTSKSKQKSCCWNDDVVAIWNSDGLFLFSVYRSPRSTYSFLWILKLQ